MATSKFDRLAPGLMSRLMAGVGFTVLDAAAAVGNGGHESGGFAKLQEINPTVKGSRGGYGWFQWTGPRRRAFEAWCAKNKLDPSSDEANAGFFLAELQGSEKAAVAKTKAAGKGLPEQAALVAKVKAFELAYERAGVKHYDSRVAYAQRALKAYRLSGL